MDRARVPLSRRVVIPAVLGLVAALFVVNDFVLGRAYDASVARVNEIVDNAVPSITELTELRRALRDAREEVVLATTRTERAEHERRLESLWVMIRGSLRNYRKLPVFASEVGSAVDLEGAVASVLSSGEATLGASDDETASRLRVQEFLPAVDRADDLLLSLVKLNAHEASNVARVVVATHEQARVLSWVLLAGVVAGVAAIGFLATRLLERADQEIVRRIEELDAFAARVAHDLRGPLTPVRFAFSIVKADQGLTKGSRDAIARGESSIERALSLMEGLLAFARAGARAEPGACSSVATVGREVALDVAPLLESENATLAVEIERDLAVAAAAPVVASIVGNLVRNAILYLGESEQRRVTLRARATEEGVAIEVADTGPGIPADVLARIFRPFERGSTRPGGHGLGLATVKRLVESHGGTVGVTSDVARGSVFSVRLPRAPK
jgi:signal transduction histidine kinase